LSTPERELLFGDGDELCSADSGDNDLTGATVAAETVEGLPVPR
jgi:hypothetical protein